MTKSEIKIFFFLSSMLLAASCGNTVSEDILPGEGPETEGTTTTVQLHLSEEQISTSDTPLTRAVEAGKYYGVNIYKKNGNSYEKYAYGLFNDPSKMSLLLVEGDKYKIECLELKNDKDTLFHQDDLFYYPFMIDKKPTKLSNEFTYSSKVSFPLDTTAFATSAQRYLWFPRAYSYYASLDNFDPADSSNVSILLKRAIFGLHFIIVPPEDGVATLTYLNTKTITVKAGDNKYDDGGQIFSFHNLINASKDGYSGTVPTFITWSYSDGTVVKDTANITLSRNMMTTVNLDFSGPKTESIGVTEENTAMGSDTYDWHVGK